MVRDESCRIETRGIEGWKSQWKRDRSATGLETLNTNFFISVKHVHCARIAQAPLFCRVSKALKRVLSVHDIHSHDMLAIRRFGQWLLAQCKRTDSAPTLTVTKPVLFS